MLWIVSIDNHIIIAPQSPITTGWACTDVLGRHDFVCAVEWLYLHMHARQDFNFWEIKVSIGHSTWPTTYDIIHQVVWCIKTHKICKSGYFAMSTELASSSLLRKLATASSWMASALWVMHHPCFCPSPILLNTFIHLSILAPSLSIFLLLSFHPFPLITPITIPLISVTINAWTLWAKLWHSWALVT